VEAEAREFGRRRLKERLQELADQQGEVFPPKAVNRCESGVVVSRACAASTVRLS